MMVLGRPTKPPPKQQKLIMLCCLFKQHFIMRQDVTQCVDEDTDEFLLFQALAFILTGFFFERT
jgi:hypothetical protein